MTGLCMLHPGCVVPSIVIGLVMVGSGDRSAMVCGPPGAILNSIVSGPALRLASSMARRSVPALKSSAVEVTVNVRGLTVTAVVSVTPLFVVSGSASFALTDVVTGTMLPPATVESSSVKVSVCADVQGAEAAADPGRAGHARADRRRDGDQVQTVDVTRRVDHHVGRRVRTVDW